MRFCLFATCAAALWVETAQAAPLARLNNTPARLFSVTKADPRTGQLIRTIVVAGAPRNTVRSPFQLTNRPSLTPAQNTDLKALIESAAAQYEVSPALIDSVVQVESNYNPNAVSPKGAQGLMQLMPATARRFGATDSFDPKQNIEAGVRYLKFLQKTFKDDKLAIAAYNAGEGAVQKYGTIPPYRETVDYVAKVGKRYGQSKTREAASRKTEGAAEAPKPPEYRKLVAFIDPEGKVFLTTQ